MPLDAETKAHLQSLQSEAEEILGELADMFPPGYVFTLVARNSFGVEDTDIVLMDVSETPDELMAAINVYKDRLVK